MPHCGAQGQCILDSLLVPVSSSGLPGQKIHVPKLFRCRGVNSELAWRQDDRKGLSEDS